MSGADGEATDSRDVAGECEPERARRKVPNLDRACEEHTRVREGDVQRGMGVRSERGSKTVVSPIQRRYLSATQETKTISGLVSCVSHYNTTSVQLNGTVAITLPQPVAKDFHYNHFHIICVSLP